MNLVELEDFNARYFRDKPRPADELQRWCRTRVLPARKIGGKWFVDVDAFERPETKPKENHDPDALARSILDQVQGRERH